jgi:hypothetical protein
MCDGFRTLIHFRDPTVRDDHTGLYQKSYVENRIFSEDEK